MINMTEYAKSIIDPTGIMGKVKPDPRGVTCDMIYEAIRNDWDNDRIDNVNLNEMIKDMQHEYNYILNNVAKRLKKDLDLEVENSELCPECFQELNYGGYKMAWYEDFGRNEPTMRICEGCGYEEEL